MRCEAEPDPERELVQTVVVTVNGHRLAKVEVPEKWGDLTVPVPEKVQRRGQNEIKFAFAYDTPMRTDERASRSPVVSARFQALRLELAPRTGRTRSRGRQDIEAGHGPVYDADRERFVVSRPGRLVVPITIPDAATGLGLEIRAPKSLNRKRTNVTLTIENLDGEPRRTRRLPLDARRFEESPGVLAGEVSVEGFQGVACLLTFQVDPRPRGSAIEIALPVPITPTSAPSDIVSAGPAWAPGDPNPDIVLITLDAARPDHFSCYGYDRPTTPNIDRLAEESLVFSNAFALAPYTRCSVPTMITGLSFLDHGVVSDQEGLSDVATTLAEYLGNAGYTTACFSANPNNSRSRGLDQGYDEFFEMWRRRTRGQPADPHRVSQRVLEWLASQDETTPLHLQLHYLPPHSPYRPAPAFNLFTDPTYDGRFTGNVRTLRGINTHRLKPTDTDIAHIAALYDGNLRMVDDAVGEVLRALQKRGRWRDTVVLVTSDHGDALYEHGRMGHNSTLFDEMLRVPFILRLPAGSAGEGIDAERLVSLADITPTLIAGAGILPPDDLDGIDLVGGAHGDRRAVGRYLVLRDAHNQPLLGLRSLRWKAMLAPSGHGALYDVRNDPAERDDLVLERPDLFVALAQLVTQRVSRPARVPPSAVRPEVDETDREMLRALGYAD
jgi:arylsulfatase